MLLVLASLIIAAAGSVSAKTIKNSTDWHWEQDYYNWGPAYYYGENVRCIYDAVNSWNYNEKDGDLYQHLQQKGTVSIYSLATGELLDVRQFVCHERVVDEGIDANTWDGVWYAWTTANWGLLELVDYDWLIPGVYHFHANIKEGVLTAYEYEVPGVIEFSWI